VADSSALPLAGGVMTGNYSQDMIAGTAGLTVIKRPIAFTVNTATNTGTIKINLPVGMTNTMMRMRIVGYDYSGNTGAWEINLGGYNYLPTPAWLNTNVRSAGDSPFTSVRFAYDNVAQKACILLGTTSTVLNYPKIVVEEVVIGFSNVSSATWRTGWTISQITDESQLVFINTPVFKNITDYAYTITSSPDAPSARAALDVYGTAETYNRSQTYSRAEIDALIAASLQNATPLFSVQWWPSRAAVPVGYVTADGTLLSRATYPDAWAGISAGRVPSVADGTWTAGQVDRGKYTPGNGSTNFRIPDYNGVTGGSVGALFLRGDGGFSAGNAGQIQTDALQNITGSAQVSNNVFRGTTTGANFYTAWNAGHSVGGVNGTYSGTQINFDASLVARTATETRPMNVTGCWIIKIQGPTSGVFSSPLPDNYVSPEPKLPQQLDTNIASTTSAQVKFDGMTTEILNSENISSVTNLGTGKYRINFIEMDNDEYYVSSTLTGVQYVTVLVSDATKDGVTIDVVNSDSEHVDIAVIGIIVLGGNYDN
jgi:hypothetical protein